MGTLKLYCKTLHAYKSDQDIKTDQNPKGKNRFYFKTGQLV